MKNKKIILEIGSYILIFIVVLLIKSYVVSPIRVNGNSMYKTLHDQDIMILNEFTYYFNDIERLDIAVVKEDGDYLIKRVIGLPGEIIKCENGVVFINNKKLEEPYVFGTTSDFDEVVIGDDEYFVMGDNREVSLDSRVYGTYKKKYVVGKATYTIFPFSRFGMKK